MVVSLEKEVRFKKSVVIGTVSVDPGTKTTGAIQVYLTRNNEKVKEVIDDYHFNRLMYIRFKIYSLLNV